LEYALQGQAEVYFTVADVGNGSYAPQPIQLDSTVTGLTKMRYAVSPAKWKLLTVGFSAALDAGLVVNLDGTELSVRDWGSDQEYRKVNPFKPSGGFGSQD
jgi:hypothetical protein